MPSYNEKELLQDIASGNEDSFALIVKAHWKNIYTRALSWIRSAEEAEELTQDIFLKIWNNRHQLLEVENFENWLFIIARNAIVSGVRKKLNAPDFLQLQDAESHHWNADSLVETKQHYQLLLQGINLLPDKRQQVFRMSRLDGLSHAQIAEQLGISKDTVAQYIVKAVDFLKVWLREQTGSEILTIILLAGLY